jgi:serine/threonine-protein kinase
MPPPDPAKPTEALAQDIDSLLFKTCATCRTVFSGSISSCPHDGSRLVEQSMLARKTLLAGGATGAVVLKKVCPSCKGHFALHLETCDTCKTPLEIPTHGGDARHGESEQEIGTVIANKYRLLKDIGSGGFGSVFLAKHESLGKRYAVKLLRSKFSKNTEFRNRFHEEALKLSRLEDENIVKVIDFGESEDFQYMVTEFIDGRSLGDIIYEAKVAPLRAAKILQQVASALSEAHSKRIVHLDLKPDNVLIAERRGTELVKVIDFGIAEIYSETRGGQQAVVGGTPPYMAPEQWNQGVLDQRTDIYSFGIILYEFLAGRPPFRQITLDALKRAHCEALPEPLRKLRPDVPVELERIAQRCMEKKPDKRFSSVDELKAALGGYIRRTEDVLAKRLRWIAAAATVFCILGVAAWGVWESRKDTTRPLLTSARFGAGDDERVFSPEERGAWKTQGERVNLVLEAEDDRRLDHFVVRHLSKEEKVELERDASVDATATERLRHAKFRDIRLQLGSNPVRVWAVDGSGNRSDETTLTIERLEKPRVTLSTDRPPESTREDSVELKFQDLDRAKVHITASSGDPRSAHFEVAIWKDEEGAYHASPPDKVERLPRPGERFSLPIPLKAGLNAIAVSQENLLTGERVVIDVSRTGERVASGELVVESSNEEFKAHAEVKTEDGVVVLLRSGHWLTGKERITVRLKIDPNRVSAAAGVGFVVNGEKRVSKEWTAPELETGIKEFETQLGSAGENKIVLERIVDRFGNSTKEQELYVELDRDSPELSFPETDVATYYNESLPKLRFRLVEPNLPSEADGQALEIRDRDGIPIPDSAYKIAKDRDQYELCFLSAAALQEEGEHPFFLSARDRVGNRSQKPFKVLVDHSAPVVEVLSPSEGQVFRRSDSIPIKLRITDAFPETLKTGGTMTVNWRDPKSPAGAMPPIQTPLMLQLNATGFWEGSVDLSRTKPGLFGPPPGEAASTSQPRFTIAFTVTDRSGRTTSPPARTLAFSWEIGDGLVWRDGSILVFHEKCPGVHTPFFIAKWEVSNWQYQAFLDAQGGAYQLKNRKWWSERAEKALSPGRTSSGWSAGRSHPKSSEWRSGRCETSALDLPVRGVSWYEAEAYSRWAGLKIPELSMWLTAAFWDYKTSKVRDFPWDDVGPAIEDAALSVACDLKRPVKLADLTPFADGNTPQGLCHIFGNVWEIVLDAGSPQGPRVVIVGGSFEDEVALFRQVNITSPQRRMLRGSSTIENDYAVSTLGFRLALPLPPGDRP